MSEILVDNLTGKTSAGDITVTSEGGAATQSLQQGIAKSWVNFDSTSTLAILDSLNTSSVTDRGVGQFTQNFSSSWSAAVYVLTGGGTTSHNYLTSLDSASIAPTTSAAAVETLTSFGTQADTIYGMFTYHGDLA